MPEFLDLFVREVKQKRESIEERLREGHASVLDEDFRVLFDRNWHALPGMESEDFHLLAIDGSQGLREYVNGSRFYVVRAYGLTNKGEEFRLLETNVFLARGREEDIRTYINRKTEYMELKLALQAAHHLRGERRVILIDGSLYGRMMHLPRDVPIEGDRSFLLEYMHTYSKLLDVCRRENIFLIGVSKHSRAEYLRNMLLDRICQRELHFLTSSLPSQEVEILESCVKNIGERPIRSIRSFRKLKDKHGRLLDKFENILIEYRLCRTDFQMIDKFASQPGYSTPLELGVRAMIWFKEILKNPERFFRRYFRESISDKLDYGEVFIKEGVKTIRNMTKFPTIVSFNLLLDRRDNPLRIDVPSWLFGVDNTVGDITQSRFLSEEFYKIAERVISILRVGYAGLRGYNVWLDQVDVKVRLHRADMDALYERLLEKELGLTLIHTRGYRRVKYP